ncbi:hypothetical protein CN525_16720 [Bacillus sp. AFS014408]|nr:hypothetical protein CN525_16720 [Bacillus sp. AFS014408]
MTKIIFLLNNDSVFYDLSIMEYHLYVLKKKLKSMCLYIHQLKNRHPPLLFRWERVSGHA